MGASTSALQPPVGYFPQGAAAYVPAVPVAVSGMSTTSSVMLGLFVGFLVIIVVVAAMRATTATTTVDQAPVPISGKTGGTIPATGIPLSRGSDYALQFWMFVQDWDYKFGQEKEVLMRTDATDHAIVSPRITLHPTDNTLNVYLTTYASGSTATAAAQPGAANGASSNGTMFVAAVENIPLQTWFSVSVTVFQRNMDIFINGNLVKSAVIPAVPRPATGNLLVGANGGFSGYVCNVHGQGSQLMPSQARDFYGAGTSCKSLVSGDGAAGPTGTVYNLFGYTIIIEDPSGKQVTASSILSPGSNGLRWNPFESELSNAPILAQCPANKWSTTGSDTDGQGTGCKACPAGSTSTMGSKKCSCPTGKTWDVSGGTCI